MRSILCQTAGAWLLLSLLAPVRLSVATPTDRATGTTDHASSHDPAGCRFHADRTDAPTLISLRLGKPKDKDGDGVIDREDGCPDTPAAAIVGPQGCPSDADRDGVFDGIDQCAGTAQGATVDTAGCPRDSDGDGVLEGLDLCPDTAPQALIDPEGCPYDTDGDGCLDGIDRCPASPVGVPVDEKGCRVDTDGEGVAEGLEKSPDARIEQAAEASGCSGVRTRELVLPTIRFSAGGTTIAPGSSTALNELAHILQQDPCILLEIGGHTDNQGPANANRSISLQRAEEVKAYLFSQGVPASRLTTRGYGEVHPIATNRTAEGRAENRRIEFRILPP